MCNTGCLPDSRMKAARTRIASICTIVGPAEVRPATSVGCETYRKWGTTSAVAVATPQDNDGSTRISLCSHSANMIVDRVMNRPNELAMRVTCAGNMRVITHGQVQWPWNPVQLRNIGSHCETVNTYLVLLVAGLVLVLTAERACWRVDACGTGSGRCAFKLAQSDSSLEQRK
jgi:hypothetical protein